MASVHLKISRYKGILLLDRLNQTNMADIKKHQAHGSTPQPTGPKASKDVPSIVQVSRPFLTHAELSFLHNHTIAANKRTTYNQQKHQIFQYLFQVVKIMKLPLRVLSLAMNYYQRYYLFYPYGDHPDNQNTENDPIVEAENDSFLVATTCLFLASKNEDCIKKLKDIQTVANRVRDLDSESRNFLKGGASSSVSLVDFQRKVIMNLEFKLLQVIKFDFTSGAGNVPSVDQLVVIFAKQLKLTYKFTLFAWLISFDIMSTPLLLTIPPHCIALAIIIVTLNLRPTDINTKYAEDYTEDTSISATLDSIDSMKDFRCPETLVNEGIVYILDYYVHQMNFLVLNEYMPPVNEEIGKAQIFKFMELKSRFNDLSILNEQSASTNQLLKQDKYLRKWDAGVCAKGAARFMIATKRRRFDAEFVLAVLPKRIR